MNIAPKRISNKKLTDLANNSSPAQNGRSNDSDYRNQVNRYSQNISININIYLTFKNEKK